MTVKELLDTCTCDVWITSGEDPNREEPEIKISTRYDYDETDFLSDDVINSEVHLITALNDTLLISLFWDNPERSEE